MHTSILTELCLVYKGSEMVHSDVTTMKMFWTSEHKDFSLSEVLEIE